MIVGRTMWTQSTSVTDRQTGGRTDRITMTKTARGKKWSMYLLVVVEVVVVTIEGVVVLVGVADELLIVDVVGEVVSVLEILVVSRGTVVPFLTVTQQSPKNHFSER